MQVDIQHRPSYSLGIVKLSAREQLRVEGGAMVSMTSGMQIQTGMQGGLLKALGRSVLGGESFFMNTYTAPDGGGEVTVAPALPGDMVTLDMTSGQDYLVQSGSYIASELSVNIDTKWGGAKTFFGGEGFIMLRASGQGKMLVSSYGAIFERELAPGEVYTVDTGHLVAFPTSMPFKIRRVGGMKSTLFSGEGLVVDMTGPGQILMQTRSIGAFLSWLIPHLPKSNSGS